MTDIHLHEIYSSLVTDTLSKIDHGNLIRWRVKTIRADQMGIPVR